MIKKENGTFPEITYFETLCSIVAQGIIKMLFTEVSSTDATEPKLFHHSQIYCLFKSAYILSSIKCSKVTFYRQQLRTKPKSYRKNLITISRQKNHFLKRAKIQRKIACGTTIAMKPEKYECNPGDFCCRIKIKQSRGQL